MDHLVNHIPLPFEVYHAHAWNNMQRQKQRDDQVIEYQEVQESIEILSLRRYLPLMPQHHQMDDYEQG